MHSLMLCMKAMQRKIAQAARLRIIGFAPHVSMISENNSIARSSRSS